MPGKWVPVPGPDARWEVELANVLGEGGFGSVYRGKDKEKNRDCAAKKVNLTKPAEKESYETELEVLQVVEGHESIIHLFGQERHGDEGWLFLEMATGGELFDRLIDSGNLSEHAAWPYVSAIASAVGHCHSKGIIHRDLKLENVMLCADDPYAIRLIDFGLAVRVGLGADGKPLDEVRTDSAGTQAYRAPEVNIGGGYSPLKVDVWALGIILFSLVAGFFPLQEAKVDDWRFKRLAKDQAKGMGACDSVFGTYKRQCFFSDGLRDLIDKMLAIDPNERFSIDDVLTALWIAKAPAAPQAPVDGDGDPITYRGTDVMDLDQEPMDIPPDAVPLARQRAQRC